MAGRVPSPSKSPAKSQNSIDDDHLCTRDRAVLSSKGRSAFESLQRDLGDAAQLLAATLHHGHVKSEDWNTRVATILDRLLSRRSTETMTKQAIQATQLVPLKSGGQAAVSDGPIYFPATDDGVPVPEDLSLKLVDPSAVEDPARRKFFATLGVQHAPKPMVVNLILERYDNIFDSIPATPECLAFSVSHLKYLFWYMPPGIRSLPTDFYIFSKDLTICDLETVDVYFDSDEEYAVQNLLSHRTGDVHSQFTPDIYTIHPDYQAAASPTIKRGNQTFDTWLQKFIGVRRYPRLLNRSNPEALSDVYTFLLKGCGTAFLGYLQRYWDSYTKAEIGRLWSHKLFPVRNPRGEVTWESIDAEFFIVDRVKLKHALEKEVPMLDCSLRGVRRLERLIQVLGLEDRYLSRSVSISTCVKNGWCAENDVLTTYFRLKAAPLTRYASHFQADVSSEQLFAQLQNATVYESNEITEQLSLPTGENVVVVENTRGRIHIEKGPTAMAIYVPKDPAEQTKCYLRDLPLYLQALLDIYHPGTDRIIASIVNENDVSILDDLLDDEGIPRLDGLERVLDVRGGPVVGESSVDALEEVGCVVVTDAALVSPSPLATFARFSRVAGVYIPAASPTTSAPSSIEDRPETPIARHRRRTSEISSANTSKFETPPTGTQEFSNRLWGSDATPTKAVHRLQPTAALDGGRTLDVESSSPLMPDDKPRSYSDGSIPPQHHDEYRTLAGMKEIMTMAMSATIRDEDASDVDAPEDARPTNEHNVETFKMLEAIFVDAKAGSESGRKKIGAYGELYVFEYLSTIIPTLTHINWPSTIRNHFSIHHKYASAAFPPFTGPEKSDIVFSDTNGTFTSLLIAKRYLDETTWISVKPTYWCEVKATRYGLENEFYVGRGQVNMMKWMALREGKAAADVYIIFRVYNLGRPDISMRLYIDPAGKRERGGLEFVKEVKEGKVSYRVTPVKKCKKAVAGFVPEVAV